MATQGIVNKSVNTEWVLCKHEGGDGDGGEGAQREQKGERSKRDVCQNRWSTSGCDSDTRVCVYTGNVEMRATPPVCVCNCTSDTPGIYICDRATAASLQTNVSELRGVYTTL